MPVNRLLYPLYQLGNPQLRIFRPNWFLTLVRPGKEQPTDTVQFRVPMDAASSASASSVGVETSPVLSLITYCPQCESQSWVCPLQCVALLVSPEVPLQLGLDSGEQICLQSLPSMERVALQYTVCVGHNVKAAHLEAMQQLSLPSRELPNLKTMLLPFWKLLTPVDSGPKVERELRIFSNRLKRHQLGEAVISLNEHSTTLLYDLDHDYLSSRRRGMSKRLTRDFPLVKLLNISITLSPFLGVDSTQFHSSLVDGTETYWLSVPSNPQGHMVPILSQWQEKFCVKLNLTNPSAVSWFLDRVGSLQARLGVEYMVLEGAEGSALEEQALRTQSLSGDRYISLLADLASRIENTIVTAGTQSSHKPLFVRMTPLQSDWSGMGLKGIIPSLLHHALMGYNFLIPDAVGGSLSEDLVTDEELFIRWLEIVAFLPVISFHTPPWICGEDRVGLCTLHHVHISSETWRGSNLALCWFLPCRRGSNLALWWFLRCRRGSNLALCWFLRCRRGSNLALWWFLRCVALTWLCDVFSHVGVALTWLCDGFSHVGVALTWLCVGFSHVGVALTWLCDGFSVVGVALTWLCVGFSVVGVALTWLCVGFSVVGVVLTWLCDGFSVVGVALTWLCGGFSVVGVALTWLCDGFSVVGVVLTWLCVGFSVVGEALTWLCGGFSVVGVALTWLCVGFSVVGVALTWLCVGFSVIGVALTWLCGGFFVVGVALTWLCVGFSVVGVALTWLCVGFSHVGVALTWLCGGFSVVGVALTWLCVGFSVVGVALTWLCDGFSHVGVALTWLCDGFSHVGVALTWLCVGFSRVGVALTWLCVGFSRVGVALTWLCGGFSVVGVALTWLCVGFSRVGVALTWLCVGFSRVGVALTWLCGGFSVVGVALTWLCGGFSVVGVALTWLCVGFSVVGVALTWLCGGFSVVGVALTWLCVGFSVVGVALTWLCDGVALTWHCGCFSHVGVALTWHCDGFSHVGVALTWLCVGFSHVGVALTWLCVGFSVVGVALTWLCDGCSHVGVALTWLCDGFSVVGVALTWLCVGFSVAWRGSNLALLLDVSGLDAEPLCTVSTPKEVWLQLLHTSSRRLSSVELREAARDTSGLQQEYQKIPPNFVSSMELNVPGHMMKDRYKTILPNPETRVVLKSPEEDPGPDRYINANYIRGYKGAPRAFIATQGPMVHTVGDFWDMVWQERASAIVMLTQLKEEQQVRSRPAPGIQDGGLFMSVARAQ
uniref:protein-tyrosine-phosphatase n=1 Tax=Knipowitschia caucasica TaxID=637954 RepID=A0AAV2KZS7_KNICA